MRSFELEDQDNPVTAAPPQRTILYSNPAHYMSHFIYWALLEKQIIHQHVLVQPDQRPEFLAELNPYGSLPILVERHIRLFHPETIIEYIEDRYRQCPLWPDNVNEKAQLRQLFWRIRQDWMQKGCRLMDFGSQACTPQEATRLRQQLRDSLIEISPLFKEKPWFMSDQPSYCDLLLGVFLCRLPAMNISLPRAHCIPLLNYINKMEQRPAFQQSLLAFSLE